MAAKSQLTLVTGAGLPRFIAVEATMRDPGSGSLTLAMNGGAPFLTFTEKQRTRRSAHEVVYNADVEGMVMLRSANGRFWQRTYPDYVVASREGIPSNPTSDPGCYFRVFRLGDGSGHFVFQSVLDGNYLHVRRAGVQNYIPLALHASATDPGNEATFMIVTSAVEVAVVLPRYLMLFGDNQRYVGDHRERDIDWLKFNKDTPRLSATHEIIPHFDGTVMVLNVNLQRFWRRSPNWIWADVSSLSSAQNNNDCHFDVLKLSSTLVAFQSVANDRLLKRYTEYWEDCLCAVGTSINDSATRLLVREAALSRTLFDIRYLLALAEVSDITPVLVGSGSMFNDTNLTTDLEVQVTLTKEVSNSKSWSNSTTFSTSFTVGFSVGVPEVASVNGSVTIGHESTFSTELGSTITTGVQFQTTYKVQGVPPKTEIKVTVECTTAKCRIPFTYKSRDTRIDGIDMPPEEHIDGIFEGVNAFNIRGVASEVLNGIKKSDAAYVVFPVSVTNT